MRWKRKSQNQEEEKRLNNLANIINKSILSAITMQRMLFYLLLIFAPSAFSSNTKSGFNASLLKAQNDVYHLRLTEAEITLSNEIKNRPENISAYHLQELSFFLKAFISETSKDFVEYEKNRIVAEKKITLLPSGDQYRPFMLSELCLHKGLLLLKSANYTGAALSFKDAYSWCKKSIEKHPDFLPAYKGIALLESAAAHLGPSFHWVIKLSGINPNNQHSVRQTLKFIQSPQIGELEWMRRDAAFMMGYIHWQLNQKTLAWKLIQSNTEDYPTNPLSLYFHSVFAHKSGMNDHCLKSLGSYSARKNEIQIPFLYYLKGLCQLQKLDTNCLRSFQQFLGTHQGMHYIKACHLKMAWGHLIFGRLSQFHHSMSMVKSQGQSITEEDKQALIEARRKTIPHPKLLIARLLFDGGYNRLALQYIQPLKASDFHSALEKTEYCYRKGRIYQSLNQNTLAIAFYEAAISTGKILEVYYASYACIYIAEINEDQGNRTLALKYYKLATSFKNNSEYVQSIEQKAASGIRRLK